MDTSSESTLRSRAQDMEPSSDNTTSVEISLQPEQPNSIEFGIWGSSTGANDDTASSDTALNWGLTTSETAVTGPATSAIATPQPILPQHDFYADIIPAAENATLSTDQIMSSKPASDAHDSAPDSVETNLSGIASDVSAIHQHLGDLQTYYDNAFENLASKHPVTGEFELQISTAKRAWAIFFGDSARPYVHLQVWLAYLDAEYNHAVVDRRLWSSFFRFATTISDDFSNFSSFDSSWHSALREFVAFACTNLNLSGAGASSSATSTSASTWLGYGSTWGDMNSDMLLQSDATLTAAPSRKAASRKRIIDRPGTEEPASTRSGPASQRDLRASNDDPMSWGSDSKSIISNGDESEPMPLWNIDDAATSAASNSKPTSGFAGLSNQGATCYMNSLLQSLFMTPEFRNTLFNWHYGGSDADAEECITLQLQLLFTRLQSLQSTSIKTTALTKSFGWTGSQAFAQHDVQELMHKLFQAFEIELGSSMYDRLVSNNYQGVSSGFVRCCSCGFESTREQTFHDFPIVVRDVNSFSQAMCKHFELEHLDADNAYFCDKCQKKQPADKGTRIVKLPHIFMVSLKRFDFDLQSLSRVKLNHRITFPFKLDMDRYVGNDVKVKETKTREADEQEDRQEDQEQGPVDVDVDVDVEQSSDATEMETDKTPETQLSSFSDLPLPDWATTSQENELVNTNNAEVSPEESVWGRWATSDTTTTSSADNNTADSSSSWGTTGFNSSSIWGTPASESATDAFAQAAAQASEQDSQLLADDEEDKLDPSMANQYELFSVLVHSGGALGGHYFAFVKNVETDLWYKFNDSSVTKVCENDVKRASFGSSSGSWGSSSNAYMLMYRCVSNTPPSTASMSASGAATTHSKFVAYQDIPVSLRDTVDAETEELEKERDPNFITFDVYCRDDPTCVDEPSVSSLPSSSSLLFETSTSGYQSKRTRISKASPFSALEDSAFELFRTLLEAYSIVDRDLIRVRKFNLLEKRATNTFDGRRDSTLDELGFFGTNNVVVEVRRSTDEPWLSWQPGDMSVQTLMMDRDKKQYQDAVAVRCNHDWSLGKLRNAISETYGVDPAHLFCYTITENLNHDKQLEALGGDETSLLAFSITDGKEIFVELLQNANDSSAVVEVFNRDRNLIVIKYNKLGSSEYDQQLTVDKHSNLGHLKQILSACLELSSDDFKICSTSSSWVFSTSSEYRDMEMLVSSIGNQGCVHVERGQPLLLGQHTVCLSLYSLEVPKKADRWSPLGDIRVMESTSVREMKELACEELKKVQSSFVLDLDPALIRLRDVDTEVATRIFTDDMVYADIMGYAPDNRKVAVQVISKPDPPGMFVPTCQLWRSSTWELGDAVEVCIEKRATMEAFALAISKQYGIAVEHIALHKSYRYETVDETKLATLDWKLPMDDENRGKIAASYPWDASDGELFLVRDLTEDVKNLTSDEKKQMAARAPKSDSGWSTDWVFGGSADAELSIKARKHVAKGEEVDSDAQAATQENNNETQEH
jgi:ubiquitin carboxyl-terminal hydrolase 47